MKNELYICVFRHHINELYSKLTIRIVLNDASHFNVSLGYECCDPPQHARISTVIL